MSYRTDRLVALFPAVYAATEPASLLHRLVDTVGAELTTVDDTVKLLLKSHWVDYATGPALDGLGAIYGVDRRTLRDGTAELDEPFRRRLRSVVQLFTGGGTTLAVKGAVRSALGLPFDLATLNLPVELLRDLEELVALNEFPPVRERVLADTLTEVDGAAELRVVTDAPSMADAPPRIEWTMTESGVWLFSVERLDVGLGVRSGEALAVAAGSTLVLTNGADGTLSAVLDGHDVTGTFTDLAGNLPAALPPVPQTHSEWRFRANGARFDVSLFDAPETFDLPAFRVTFAWSRAQPLTFDVVVPYFVQTVVADLVARHGYKGDVFIYQGLPLDVIPQIVDQTRAAGVQAGVHFSLEFLEAHNQRDRMTVAADHRVTEDADAFDALTMGSLNTLVEEQDAADRFGFAALFDVSTFDGPFSYG